MKCFATPRSSGGSKELRCANGELGSGWNGCVNQDSARIQCPKGHYPCNSLRGVNGHGSIDHPEFVCSTKCKDSDRAKDCTGRYQINNLIQHYKHSLERKCIGESRTDILQLCDDGSTLANPGQTTDRCYKEGSALIQCPSNQVPCNEMEDESVTTTGYFTEFTCNPDCNTEGGKRTCFADANGDD